MTEAGSSAAGSVRRAGWLRAGWWQEGGGNGGCCLCHVEGRKELLQRGLGGCMVWGAKVCVGFGPFRTLN